MKWRCWLVLLTLAPGCTHDWSLPLVTDTVDAASRDDAATSEPDAGDAGSSCAGALLCEPFDGPNLAQWDDVIVAPGGRAALEAFPGALSPPNVLVAERPSQDETSSTAYVAKLLLQPLSRVRMELAVSPSQLDPTSFATVAAIVFEHQRAGEHKIRLGLRRDAAQLQELGATSVVLASHPLPRGLPLDTWSRVAMEVEAGGRIRVRVDGTSVIDVAATTGWRTSDRTLVLTGINFIARPHEAIRVRIDDVRVDGS